MKSTDLCEFRLKYGERSWPEFNTTFQVTPFVLVQGVCLSFSTAIRKGILDKKDRDGLYCTSVGNLRFLITGMEQGKPISPINIFIGFNGKDTVHSVLYPPSISSFAWESGFFFAANNVTLLRNCAAITKVYSLETPNDVGTITPESIATGIALSKVVTTQITAKSRFS